jgi:hypothetical protein
MVRQFFSRRNLPKPKKRIGQNSASSGPRTAECPFKESKSLLRVR